MPLHSHLQVQLRLLGADPSRGLPDAQAWAQLLTHISARYDEQEEQLVLLQRSQQRAADENADLCAELNLSQARLSSLLSLSADWIWEQDADLRFNYVSGGAFDVAGVEPPSLIGRRRFFGNDREVTPEALAGHEADIAGRRAFRDFDSRLTRPDGVVRWIRISGEPVFDDSGHFKGYRGVGRDITDATLAQQRVERLASFDSLTGLPNRNLFLTELERSLARARRTTQNCAVCFIDLDRFKTINDTLGHDAGDELLTVMAQRLRGALRASDLVARHGGDEFVVLLEGGGDAGDLAAVAHKLLAAMREPLLLRDRVFHLSGSIGLSVFPDDADDAPTLLAHADAAMYLAKERGKNKLQFYTSDLAEQAARQFMLESELRLALARDELVLHYQPRMDLKSGRLCGAEALLRWNHPTRGLVGPAEFIALAEERGLIVQIGRWVMHAACRQMQQWRAQGLAAQPVAINLSAMQFASDGLVDDLLEAMTRHQVSASDIEVEITESALMADPELANEVLQRLASLGVKIAIDDFGTGYSSLSYLKRFPAQTVKIDRSFIHGLPGDQDDVIITQAVIAMAHSLGLSVVAEGVELESQLALLRELGCDEVQGYLFARPMPAAELALRLAPIQTSAHRC